MITINIVPDAKPGSPGRWITVPVRQGDAWHLRFNQLVTLYADDIPKGHHAVAFTRVAKR